MTVYQPGDILLVRDYTGGSDLVGNLIMAGERAKYGNSDYARWTHSAVIVSQAGDIVEAMADGVDKGHVSEYADKETLIISPPVPADDPRRAFAVSFALAHVGDRYDYLDFISIAGTLLTGLDLSLHSDQRFICSQLCARATESYTVSGYQYPAEQMLPADLGAYWHALSGDPLPPLSFLGRVLDKVHALAYAISPFRSGLRP